MTNTGAVRIEFSRPIKIELSNQQFRQLSDTFTDEELDQITKMIKIEYEPSLDIENGIKNEIISVKVIEATDTVIEFKIEYQEPFAVSRDPQAPDNLLISFNSTFFKDPYS